ncbi:MAG: inner membrane-spanning protein YciB [Alphaproteobacteria bacterium]
MTQEQQVQKADGSKLIMELMPLIVFFILLKVKDIYWATGALMILTPITVFIEWKKTKKLPIMPLFSLALILAFGGITLMTHNAAFIKMKPTILYLFFAVILAIGLLFKKNFIQMLMGEQLKMPQKSWNIFTQRMILFFIGLAILNELIWRNFSDGTWAIFKIVVIFLTMGFMMWQILALSPEIKEQIKEAEKQE